MRTGNKSFNPLRQPNKIVKHIQTIGRQSADELFEHFVG